MPDLVARLDERAANIVITDDAKLERNAAFLCKSNRRGCTAIRHWHDQIGLDRSFPRQLRADGLARLVNRFSLHEAVGAGEIDIFENAKTLGFFCQRVRTLHALAVQDDHLARLDIAHEIRADDVERAAFRR